MDCKGAPHEKILATPNCQTILHSPAKRDLPQEAPTKHGAAFFREHASRVPNPEPYTLNFPTSNTPKP